MHPKHRNIVIYHHDESKPEKEQWLPISDDQLELLQDDYDLPRNERQKPRNKYLQDGSPVMYMVEPDENGTEQVVFLGPTKMFRLPYVHTPLDYVPAELCDKRMIDLPEAVFGFVREYAPALDETDEQSKQRAYAGRVFFSDAKLTEPVAPQPLMMPAVLSSPKPTSFQHYLVQQALNDTSQTKGKNLLHYDTNPGDTAIRGTKQYWHQNPRRVAENLTREPETFIPSFLEKGEDRRSHTIIRPVPEGAKFEFSVHFENLSDVELGMLLWSLELPGPVLQGSEYCHRLGMAKPLGLGSVKITPHLHLEERGTRYASLTEEKDQQMVWSATQLDEDTDRKHYTDRFEAYVMQALEKAGKAFIEEERIQHVLIMLRFPGPTDSEYQSLEEFRDRKVLPLPSEVMQGGGGGGGQPRQGGGGSPRQGGGGGGGQPRQGGGGGNPGLGSGGGGGQPRQGGGGEQPRQGGSKDSGRLRSGDFLEELKRRQGG